MSSAKLFIKMKKLYLEITHTNKFDYSINSICSVIDETDYDCMCFELNLKNKECLKHIFFDNAKSKFLNTDIISKNTCIVLRGTCEYCEHVSNLVFDTSNFLFHNHSFVHNIEITNNIESEPFLIFSVIYVNDKWCLYGYNYLLNDLIFFNGYTFENIFHESFSLIEQKVSKLLNKNKCYYFAKSLKSIVEYKFTGLSYLFSFYKNSKDCIILENNLKELFPIPNTLKLYSQFQRNNQDVNIYDESWDIKRSLIIETLKNTDYKNLIITTEISKKYIEAFLSLIYTGSLKESMEQLSKTQTGLDSLHNLIDYRILKYITDNSI